MTIPPPAVDARPAQRDSQTAVLAGGCFWGVQGVFQHVDGVEQRGLRLCRRHGRESATTSGQHRARPATPRRSRSPTTRRKVSYGKLLQIFFSVAHDPTKLNRQGPDVGTQYRSAIFTTDAEQEKVAEAYIAQLDAAEGIPAPIVTEVEPLDAFYPAEDYHQDYATLHPDQPYIVYQRPAQDREPEEMFPDVWRAEPKLVFAENAM